MARILIVEDEADLREVIGYNLRSAGHEVKEAGTVADALAEMRRFRPDLVLLDLMLPDRPGTELCRKLKSDPDTESIRVVMLTARSEEVDRVVGFELGADDYVAKPFSVRELVLRVNAVLRRGAPVAEAPVEEALPFGGLVIDKARHRVTVDGEEAPLTALEFKLLWTLASRRGRVQSRERHLEDVWEMNPDVTTRTVDTHVKRLREKLGTAGEYVETVRGVGYRFAEEPGSA